MTTTIIITIVIAVVLISVSYTWGYTSAKRNVLIYFLRKKKIESSEYEELDKTDI